MKKPTLYIIAAGAALLLLLGLYPVPRRDAEKLRLVTTMAVEGTDAVTMAVSSEETGDALPGLQLTASGDSLSAAEDALLRSAGAEELYFAHVQYLLCAEDTARASLEPLFDYAQRSSQMRLTIPLYIVRGEALPLIDHTGEKNEEITAALNALSATEETPDAGILETVRHLSLRGSALVSALEAREADTLLPASGKGVLLPRRAGYAVLKGRSLSHFLPEEAVLGAEILTLRADGRELSLPCGVTVKLTEATPELTFREKDGVLLSLRVETRAALAGEKGESNTDRAEKELTEAVSAALSAALEDLTQAETDYAGLYAAFRRCCPDSALTREELLRSLRWEITGRGRIVFSYDTETEDRHEG